MIFDKKLKLAENMSIAAGARSVVGFKWSDKINISELKRFGLGEPIYCCVTIKTPFTLSTSSLVQFSLRSQLQYDPDQYVGLGAFADSAAWVGLQRDPILGSSGWIPSHHANVGNSITGIGGRMHFFAINPMINDILYDPYIPTPGTPKKFDDDGYAYFLFEEIDANTFFDIPPTHTSGSSIIAGSIDVDIVTIVSPTGGSGYNDGVYYATGTIVK
jgi:hypothetical protein